MHLIIFILYIASPHPPRGCGQPIYPGALLKNIAHILPWCIASHPLYLFINPWRCLNAHNSCSFDDIFYIWIPHINGYPQINWFSPCCSHCSPWSRCSARDCRPLGHEFNSALVQDGACFTHSFLCFRDPPAQVEFTQYKIGLKLQISFHLYSVVPLWK